MVQGIVYPGASVSKELQGKCAESLNGWAAVNLYGPTSHLPLQNGSFKRSDFLFILPKSCLEKGGRSKCSTEALTGFSSSELLLFWASAPLDGLCFVFSTAAPLTETEELLL